jgi:hypothetical protein
LRALLACPGYVFVMVFDLHPKGFTEIKNTRPTLAFLVAAYVLTCFVVTTGEGTRSHFHSYLIPMSFDGTLRFHATVALASGHSYASFGSKLYYLFAKLLF